MEPTRRAAPVFSAEPNVTPMIDVLLVLLIVFMLWITVERRVLPAQLPSDEAGEGGGIVLEVGAGERLTVDRQPVAWPELGSRLRALQAARGDRVIVIRGDARVPYQAVIAAMDSARGAGIRVTGLAPAAPVAR